MGRPAWGAEVSAAGLPPAAVAEPGVSTCLVELKNDILAQVSWFLILAHTDFSDKPIKIPCFEHREAPPDFLPMIF